MCTQQKLGSAWSSDQSDQCLRCVLSGYARTQDLFMRTAKTLIRPGWSGTLLGSQVILLALSCCGSSDQVKDAKMIIIHTGVYKSTKWAAPVAEWLRPLICSALNRSSSHRCGFELSSGHMWDEPSSACGWSGGFIRGSPVFAPPTDLFGSKQAK